MKKWPLFTGNSVRVTPQGVIKVQGIFISRLVEGGLAESTGLLAVNDEVLEVNGIEVNKNSVTMYFTLTLCDLFEWLGRLADKLLGQGVM